jgi:hypothetical protein
MPKAAARSNVSAPPAKKARVKMDAIDKKVQSMIRSFEDPDQVGLVEMPKIVRDMLVSVIKAALGHGSAKDERHAFQTSVADVIGDTFKQTVQIWEGKVSEAKALVDGADAEKTEKESAWSAASAVVEADIERVRTTQEALDAAVESVSAANKAFADAQSALENCDTERKGKEDQRIQANTLFKEHFEVLKQGDGDKSLQKPLVALLKELNAEVSLVNALGSAFGKKPDDRGQFDNMVVQQLEEVLTSHMKEIDDFLSNFEKISAERAAAVSEKKTMLEAAEAQKAACEKAFETAACAKIDGEDNLKETKEFLTQFDQKLDERKLEVEMRDASLAIAKENLETFTFLYERLQAAPEPTPEPEVAPQLATQSVDNELAA